MAHLNGLGLENFRVFKEKQWFDFAPITVLTGTNGSGKSTLFNVMQILHNFFKDMQFIKNDQVDLDAFSNIYTIPSEALISRFGNFSDLISQNAEVNVITFKNNFVLSGIVDKLQLTISYTVSQSKNCGKLIRLEIFSAKQQKAILEIVNIEDDKLKTIIDYYYFLTEFERESRQVQEYYNAQRSRENESKLSSIHPQFHKVATYTAFFSMVEPIDTIADLSEECYRIYFSNQEGFNTKEFFNNKLPLYYYPSPDELVLQGKMTKDEQFELNKYFKQRGISFNEYMIEAEKELFKDFEFSVKIRNERKVMQRIFNFINNPSLLFSMENPGMLYGMEGNDDIQFESRKKLKHNNVLEYVTKYNLSVTHEDINDIRLENDNSGYIFFKDFVVTNIIRSIQDSFSGLVGCSFLKAVRSSAKRFYSFPGDEFDLEKILTEFIKLGVKENNEIMSFIYQKLQDFNVGAKIEFDETEEGRIKVFITQQFLGQEKSILVSDLGYGVSQLLPIILAIGLHAFKNASPYFQESNHGSIYSLSNILCIEEPETNLHPALQSKLADMFIEASEEFNIQFIIETHSEYLIRRLQVLTANTYLQTKNPDLHELKVENTQIYYLYPPDAVPEGEEQVNKINIEKDGALTKNFGKGFFDESSNLNVALYAFSKTAKN